MNFKTYFKEGYDDPGQPIPDRDKLPVFFSNKLLKLIEEHKIQYDPTMQGRGSGGMLGMTDHGADGPHIYYVPGEIETLIHEIGHALMYPFPKNDSNKLEPSPFKVARMENKIESIVSKQEGMYFPGSSGEDFAQTFYYYHCPWQNVKLKSKFSEAWGIMRSHFDLPPFYIEPSDSLLEYAKYVTENGWPRNIGSQWEDRISEEDFVYNLPEILQPEHWVTVQVVRSWASRKRKAEEILQ